MTGYFTDEQLKNALTAADVRKPQGESPEADTVESNKVVVMTEKAKEDYEGVMRVTAAWPSPKQAGAGHAAANGKPPEIPKWVFDIEYSTQRRNEYQYLKELGIEPTYIKTHKVYGVKTYKYAKTPALFSALTIFYDVLAKQKTESEMSRQFDEAVKKIHENNGVA